MFLQNLFEYSFRAAPIVIGLVAICLLGGYVIPALYEYFWGRFHRKSKMRLMGKCKIGTIPGYIIVPRSSDQISEEQLETFIGTAFKEMGLCFPNRDDMCDLSKAEISKNFATKSLVAITSKKGPSRVTILTVGYRPEHSISNTDTLTKLTKFDFLIAIDVRLAHFTERESDRVELSSQAAA